MSAETEVFAEDIYIHFDRDRERYEGNRMLIALALSHPPNSSINGAAHARHFVEIGWARAPADSLEMEILFEEEAANDTLLYRGGHGFFLDIRGTVEDAARNSAGADHS